MRYLLLGVKGWVLMGGLYGVLVWIVEGDTSGAFQGALLFGGIMSAGFAFWQWRGDRRLRILGVEPRPGVRQSETFDLALSPEDAGAEAKQMLGLMPKFWVVSASLDGTEVQGRRAPPDPADTAPPEGGNRCGSLAVPTDRHGRGHGRYIRPHQCRLSLERGAQHIVQPDGDRRSQRSAQSRPLCKPSRHRHDGSTGFFSGPRRALQLASHR